MTKDEALKLALEALESVLDDSPKVLDASISGGLYEVIQCREAITAIKEALAQPVQEPVAWEQFHEHMAGSFYTHPPQRTWVGLTDEEIADCAEKMEASDPTDSFWREFFRGIEAKLKEKNT